MLIRSRSFALFCSVALSLGISSRAAAQAEGEATAAGAGKETPAEGKEAADEAAARAAEAAARKADAPKGSKGADGEADSALTPEQLAALKDAKTLANPRAPDRTSVGTRAISLPQGSGKVQGLGESFSMNLSTGVGTFSVPVPVPPARGGADPNFALSYSTSGGLGLLGQGWDIAVPYIARQTDRGAPKYDDRPSPHPEQDHFVYNGGQELIPLCVITSQACEGVTTGERFPAWAEGWQYFRPSSKGALSASSSPQTRRPGAFK